MEVPGNDDHTHHGHHHNHKISGVTSEQMLIIQQELDARLSDIGRRTANLKSKAASGKD